MKLIVHCPGKVYTEYLTRKERADQEGPLCMILYVMSLYVLADKIQGDYIGLLQSWYADEFRLTGEGDHIKPSIECIEALGNARGFFIKPYKS